ncbi:hypothetical protein NKH18_45740 [Streptomyces sp. M10(2022)]
MELLGRSRWMRFFWVRGYADYHPEYEGGRPLGRSVEALPFDTRKLGEEEAHQRPNSLKGHSGCGSQPRTTGTWPWSSAPGADGGPRS